MARYWFYVQNNEKKGPVSKGDIISLLEKKELSGQSYIWSKGFENWEKLVDVAVFSDCVLGKKRDDDFDWSAINEDEKTFFIMIGKDRGSQRETLYGPYSLKNIVNLYRENRINSRSYIWSTGMKIWKILADIDIFETAFGEPPPEIDEIERRKGRRRPFIARMLLHNNDQVYEGICRDISIGGMQVLISGFPAQLGECISFNVHPENDNYHFVATGEVVRVLNEDQGFSFRFVDISQDAKAAINRYINGEL